MTTVFDREIYYDPYDSDIAASPYDLWRRMRDHAPVYYNDRYDFWALSRYDDVVAASSDWSTYSSGQGTVLELTKLDGRISPGTMVYEDPPLHDAHRSLMAQVFSPRSVRALEPAVRRFCTALLDERAREGELDFVQHLGLELSRATIATLLAVPEEQKPVLFGTGRRDEWALITDDSPTSEIMARRYASMATLGVTRYVRWRRDHVGTDPVSDLLVATPVDDDGRERRLTIREVSNYVGLIVAANEETTSRLMGWMGSVLSTHPDQLELLRTTPGLVPGAIEELLRFESPSSQQARVVTRPVMHHGQTLPAGATVLLLTGAANRDERHFAAADQFNVEREIDRHLAFGHGVHFCIGAALVRLQARVVLEEVLSRWARWSIDWSRATRFHSSTGRGWACLPARLHAS